MLCIDDPRVREILPQISKPITSYGFAADADLRAADVRAVDGQMHFTAIRRNGSETRLPVVLNLPGRHNVLNALAAIAVASETGADDAAILKALDEFTGVDVASSAMAMSPQRRRQFHPGGRLRTSPCGNGRHPGGRTRRIPRSAPGLGVPAASLYPHARLFEDFVKVLSEVDAVVLTEVYAAGEAPIVAADGRALARALRVAGKVEPVFVENVAELPQAIKEQARDGDVVLVMGAGSIGQMPLKVAGS